MVIGKLLEALAPAASFTVTTMVAGPGRGGGARNDARRGHAQAGRQVRCALNVSGAIPPVAAKLAVYGRAHRAVGRRSGGDHQRGRERWSRCRTPSRPDAAPAASATLTLTVNLPAVFGVPLMAPAAVAVRPSGRPRHGPRVRLDAAGRAQASRVGDTHHAIRKRGGDDGEVGGDDGNGELCRSPWRLWNR